MKDKKFLDWFLKLKVDALSSESLDQLIKFNENLEDCL